MLSQVGSLASLASQRESLSLERPPPAHLHIRLSHSWHRVISAISVICAISLIIARLVATNLVIIFSHHHFYLLSRLYRLPVVVVIVLNVLLFLHFCFSY